MSTLEPVIRNSKGQFLAGISDMQRGFHRYCKQCDEPFKVLDLRMIFCSNKCAKRWHGVHRRDLEILKAFWGRVDKLDSVKISQTERFVAEKVLPKYRFYDIVHMEPIARHFFGDILARRNRRNCIIEVSTQMTRTIRKGGRRFIYNWFPLDVFICHVKPAMDWYCLKQIDVNKVPSSTCLAAARQLMYGNTDSRGIFRPFLTEKAENKLETPNGVQTTLTTAPK